jgi:hypothetical protein
MIIMFLSWPATREGRREQVVNKSMRMVSIEFHRTHHDWLYGNTLIDFPTQLTGSGRDSTAALHEASL